LAETLIVGSAATRMFAGVNLLSFATGITTGSRAGTGFYPSQDGATRITLPELAGFGPDGWDAKYIGGSFGNSSLQASVMSNIRANAASSIATAVITPILFRYGKKIFRAPLRETRKLLKGTGVTV